MEAYKFWKLSCSSRSFDRLFNILQRHVERCKLESSREFWHVKNPNIFVLSSQKLNILTAKEMISLINNTTNWVSQMAVVKKRLSKNLHRPQPLKIGFKKEHFELPFQTTFYLNFVMLKFLQS